jgi:hypothetical protein
MEEKFSSATKQLLVKQQKLACAKVTVTTYQKSTNQLPHPSISKYAIKYAIIMFIFLIFTELRTYVAHISNTFYVSVQFKHSFHFETNQSTTIEEIAHRMAAEIHNRTQKFLTLFDWISLAFSLFFLIMLIK